MVASGVEVMTSATSEEDDQKDRSSKKVMGGDQVFNNGHPKAIYYVDLLDKGNEETINGLKRSFNETMLGIGNREKSRMRVLMGMIKCLLARRIQIRRKGGMQTVSE